MEFIKLRVPTGDASRKCLSLGFHNAVNITDDFMNAVLSDADWDLVDPHTKEVKSTIKARELWQEILTIRVRTGEPYLWFIDTVNNTLNEPQRRKGLRNHGSNLCSEISLVTDIDRTAVCCLSSVNLEKYDEWKDTNLVADMITFLDNVLQIFIDNAPDFISKAKYSAQQERAIGLGVMGYHAYLKKQRWAFGSDEAYKFNVEVFKDIQTKAINQSLVLGTERGVPPDCEGSGRRNSHVMALAPTANNAIIVGTSPSIEPDNGNAYTHDTRVGMFLVKDKYLEEELVARGLNTDEVWLSIISNKGSIQQLDLPDNLKEVFKTAFEIDQLDIVKQAADRQKFIDQGQSLNLFFTSGVSRAYVNKVHLLGHKLGVKAFYYARNNADKVKATSIVNDRVVLTEHVENTQEGCESCEG